MKQRTLNGSELAGFIKERQARQVRNLRQEHKIVPRLAIVVTVTTPVITTYVNLKRRYGADILIDVDIFEETMDTIAARIETLNNDFIFINRIDESTACIRYAFHTRFVLVFRE